MKFLFIKIAIALKTHPFESLFGLPLVLFFSWYLLAIAGIFYPVLIIFFLFLVGTAGVILIARKPAFCNVENALLIVFLLFFAIIALSSHPLEMVAEGRDQGTFSASALLLQQSHGLPFSITEAKPFFELYGPGKALNFPGLAYTASGTLIPEFPLGYIVWLSGFITVFGLTGFALANVILYILSGLLFFALVKRVTPSFWSFIGTLVVLGGFLPLWFLSFTLSEHLALFLFLLTSEGLLRYQITKDRITLFLLLSSAFALALTRIEGWAILLVAFLIVTFRKDKVEWIKTVFFQKPFWGLYWLLMIAFLTLGTFLINAPYYKAIGKALWKSTGQNIQGGSLGNEALPLYHTLFEYGLFIPFFFGLLASLYLWKKRRVMLLIPFFLALPTGLYLFLPHITLDAPWMLRRFLFSLYPTLFLMLFWVLSLILDRAKIQGTSQKNSLAWLLFFLLLLGIQIPAMRQFAATRYSQTLLPQVKEFSQQFSSRDLLLIDKDVTGDNFMMPARTLSLLYDRSAVYFFNPDDLAKIDTRAYERVILVVPQDKLPGYAENLEASLFLLGEFTFMNDHSFRATPLQTKKLPQPTILSTTVSIVEIQ